MEGKLVPQTLVTHQDPHCSADGERAPKLRLLFLLEGGPW